jgi:hypothetical protein
VRRIEKKKSRRGATKVNQPDIIIGDIIIIEGTASDSIVPKNDENCKEIRHEIQVEPNKSFLS